jgi:hypothetical protein
MIYKILYTLNNIQNSLFKIHNIKYCIQYILNKIQYTEFNIYFIVYKKHKKTL